MTLNAFVGHSFLKKDSDLIREFIEILNHISKSGIDFKWEHAEEAEPKDLSIKVFEKFEGKNLFIGICTDHQTSINKDKLHPAPFFSKRLWGEKTDFKSKASDWLLQEIGFAVGRGMKIIILLENGVEKPGGIQGNIEYIPFERTDPNGSILKILEMLNSLVVIPTSSEGAESYRAVKPSEEINSPQTEQTTDDKPMSEWTIDDYGKKLILTIIDMDKTGEEEINKKFNNSQFAANHSDLVRWKAARLYYKIVWWNENGLEELLKLAGEYPDNFYVNLWVANAYGYYGEHKRAAIYYRKSSLCTENIEEKFAELIKASIAYAKSDEAGEAKLNIQQCLSIAREEMRLSTDLLIGLSDVLLELHENDDYKIFAEAALERTPEDHVRRFSLAYKYSEDNEDDAALFHYRILSERNPEGGSWNNFGVELAKLKMPALAVAAYREADKLGETLAMSNLAHKYIREGFLEEATEITNRALLIENYNKAVGDAISSIKETLDKEIVEKNKFIEVHNKRRQFFIDYSAKYLEENIKTLPEDWRSSKCVLKLSINNEILQMTGEYEELIIAQPAWSTSGSKETPVHKYIKYIGKINGLSAKFDYWISKEKIPEGVTEKPNGSGLMILDDANQKIRIYERDSKGQSSFSEIKLIV